jgi:hypothetical protein
MNAYSRGKKRYRRAGNKRDAAVSAAVVNVPTNGLWMFCLIAFGEEVRGRF